MASGEVLSIGLRSSQNTTTSRLSELDVFHQQQRESRYDDLSDEVDESLESFGYSRRGYINETVDSKRRGDAAQQSADPKPMSTRDRAISTFINTRDRIKENILKAALTSQNMLQSTVPVSFKFQDFKSDLFADVRRYCDIDPVEYADSFRNITKEKFSEGASGAFLYFSSDEKYIVKTTSEDDMTCLLEFMPAYVNHLYANPNSLLVRYLGAHCVTLYGQRLHFVVMKNLFCQLQLSERYDLKGSWVNRHCKDAGVGKKVHRRGEKESRKCPLYRDNDLQHKINLRPSVANALHDQILRDSAFLTGNVLTGVCTLSISSVCHVCMKFVLSSKSLNCYCC